jgi:hypothetical protein
MSDEKRIATDETGRNDMDDQKQRPEPDQSFRGSLIEPDQADDVAGHLLAPPPDEELCPSCGKLHPFVGPDSGACVKH